MTEAKREKARAFQAVGMIDLAEWLEAQGFKSYLNNSAVPYNGANWYACRYTKLDARPCDCNSDKGVQLVVWPYLRQIGSVGAPPQTVESVEVDVHGEAAGHWWELKCYSMTPADLREKVDGIEARLIAAWNALDTEAKK